MLLCARRQQSMFVGHVMKCDPIVSVDMYRVPCGMYRKLKIRVQLETPSCTITSVQRTKLWQDNNMLIGFLSRLSLSETTLPLCRITFLPIRYVHFNCRAFAKQQNMAICLLAIKSASAKTQKQKNTVDACAWMGHEQFDAAMCGSHSLIVVLNRQHLIWYANYVYTFSHCSIASTLSAAYEKWGM